MASSKKDLLKEIDERIKRKKALQKEVASRKTDVEGFVLKMMGEVDELMLAAGNSNLSPTLTEYGLNTIHQRMRLIDKDIQIEPQWHISSTDTTKLSGILIKWSPDYQTKNKCEPELFIDIVSLLFK